MKNYEKDDPFELKGVAIDGDPEVMIRCIIEEYARMGWGRERIMYLFETPNFQIPNRYLEEHGKEQVEKLVDRVLSEHGVFQYDVQKKEDENHD